VTNDNAPTTITRVFDPKVWGMSPKQFFVFLIPLIITSGSIWLKSSIFQESNLFTIVSLVICIFAWKFYLDMGRDKEALYNLELRMRFFFSLIQKEENIQKYNSKDKQKVKNFTRIKRIYEGGYIEFTPLDEGNNHGGILELDAYAPMDLEVFTRNAERVLSSVPDRTIIKTITVARNKIHSSADQFKRELKKPNLHPIIFDQLYELVDQCEKSEFKAYKTHIFIAIPYTSDKKKAHHQLDNVLDSTVKMLDEMGVGARRLKTENEIIGVFSELITHNYITGRN
jgi:hypothetical protein